MLEMAISLLKAHAIFDYSLLDRVKCLNDINLRVAFNWKLFIPSVSKFSLKRERERENEKESEINIKFRFNTSPPINTKISPISIPFIALRIFNTSINKDSCVLFTVE